MSKSVKTFIAAAAMLAVAAPAMAEFKLDGFLGFQGYTQNIRTTSIVGGLDPQDSTNSLTVIDQRFRPRLTYKLNDYLSFVYFAELDTVWGQETGIGGDGGQLGADRVQLETKNIYADFKIPNTSHNLRLGVQGLKDSFEGVVFFHDMAAANLTGKLGPLNYSAAYSKWFEGDRYESDDRDFYALDISHKYGDFAKAGLTVYYNDDNSGSGATTDSRTSRDAEIWWIGAYGDYRFGNFGVDGYALFQTGEYQATNQDTEAWSASVKGRMVLPNGDLGLRYIYFSADDSGPGNDDSWAGFVGEYEFAAENLMIFLVDRDVWNVAKNRLALVDGVQGGYGLHGLVASGNFKNLPMETYANFGLGGFWAADKNPRGANRVDSATLGYEVAAKVGKVFAEKFDLSLRGAYAFFGEFYDGTTATGNDPDDVYTVALMARVPF